MSKRRKLARPIGQQSDRARPRKENVPTFKHKKMPELIEIVPPPATVARFAAIFTAQKVTNWRVQAFIFGACSIILT